MTTKSKTAPRSVYQAPQLKLYGNMTSLTASGSINGAENNDASKGAQKS